MSDRQAGEVATASTPTGEGPRTAPPGEDRSPQNEQERLLGEIEETRAELGDTVDALAQKADVKGQVSEQVEQRKAAWRERREDVNARVDRVRKRAASATPEEGKRAASQIARVAEKRPLPSIAVALGLGLLIGRTLGRR